MEADPLNGGVVVPGGRVALGENGIEGVLVTADEVLDGVEIIWEVVVVDVVVVVVVLVPVVLVLVGVGVVDVVVVVGVSDVVVVVVVVVVVGVGVGEEVVISEDVVVVVVSVGPSDALFRVGLVVRVNLLEWSGCWSRGGRGWCRHAGGSRRG